MRLIKEHLGVHFGRVHRIWYDLPNYNYWRATQSFSHLCMIFYDTIVPEIATKLKEEQP